MSLLSSRDLTRVYLAPRGLAVARRKGLRPVIDTAAWHDLPGSWDAMLDGLQAVLRGPGVSRRVELRLASPLLHLALLPFDVDLHAPDLEQLAARMLIARTFGIDEASRPQRVALASARYGASRLIAALDESRAREIEAAVAAAGCRLTGMVPVLCPVFAATSTARAGARGTLALVEGDRVLLVEHQADMPLSLRVRPWHSGEDLASLAGPLPASASALCVAPGEAPPSPPWREAVLQQPRVATRCNDPRIAFAACGP